MDVVVVIGIIYGDWFGMMFGVGIGYDVLGVAVLGVAVLVLGEVGNIDRGCCHVSLGVGQRLFPGNSFSFCCGLIIALT